MTERGGGVGILGVLTIVFVVLKLVGVIHWSWWWVVSPSLIGLGFGVGILLFIVIAAAIGAVLNAKWTR